MHSERLRRTSALLGGLAIAASGCAGPADHAGQTTQALGAPPGSATEVVFPRQYTDIVIGRGIRTATGTRTAGSCIKLPDNARYEAVGREWSSEGMAVANQEEFARKFNLDSNVTITHGDATANLGLKALRELEWKSASLKFVIRVLYTYDVVMRQPDDAELTQAAYDRIAPPAAGDTPALREARARSFLKECGRYWAKGARKGAELVIVYSLNNVKRDQVAALAANFSGSVPGSTTAGGLVKPEEQRRFKSAIQGATLKVYNRGFRINAGDPLGPIAQAMDPAVANNSQLASLAGFFNDIKESVNRNYETDAAPMANPIASSVDARNVALIGQYYQPLFRTPLGPGGTLASWAGQTQTDLLTQDNALYNTISQYTTFLHTARGAERDASRVRWLSGDGQWNFPTDPEYTVAAVQARIDRVRDTVRIVENDTGPLPRNAAGGLNTDAQETGYWARRCWDLVVNNNESEECFAAAAFYNRAQTALTAFKNDLPRPIYFSSVFYMMLTLHEWGEVKKADGKWTLANGHCKHAKTAKRLPLNLRLPKESEMSAFGPFMSGNPSHDPGNPAMQFKDKFLWESREWHAWEWTPEQWIIWMFNGRGRSGAPDHPWACVRQDGPFTQMPIIY